MIDLKIFENLPKHADSILRYPENPKAIANWLKPFVKRNISLEEITDFISKAGEYYPNIEDYKESLHFLVLEETLQLKLEPWNWFQNSYRNQINNKEFIRYFKIWSITKN